MARSRFLIGMIEKIGSNHKQEDDEIFYDKQLDAMLDGSAQIIISMTDLSRECCTVGPRNTDADCSIKLLDGEDRRGKLKSTWHEPLEIDAPDAWI